MPYLRASHLAKFVKEFRYTWTHYRFKREWKKLQRQENKYFAMYNTKTLALYFSHGKIREEEAWHSLMSLLKKITTEVAERELKHSKDYNAFEKAYALRDPKLTGAMVFQGNEGVDAKLYRFLPYDLKAKPDGLIGDSVIEIKCPLGSLPDGIAINYLLQIFVEMACHGRRKAYFFQYYQPDGWYCFFQKLCDQYYSGPKRGDTVFRPWFDSDYTMYVIFQRAVRALETMDTRYEAKNRRHLVQVFWDYCYKEEKLPKPKNKEDWEEHRPAAIHLISNMTEDKLFDHGFTRWEARCIMDALGMEGNDMRMGSVLGVEGDRIHVMWQGDRIRDDECSCVLDKNTGAFAEWIDMKRFRRGILKIMKRMTFQIKLPTETWFTWKQDLIQDRLTTLPEKPCMRRSLHVVRLKEPLFERILTCLRAFLEDLKYDRFPFEKKDEASGPALISALKEMEILKLFASGGEKRKRL